VCPSEFGRVGAATKEAAGERKEEIREELESWGVK
jgi:hypothetical protein